MDAANQALMTNNPYYDFLEAEEFGFDIDSFQCDGFKVFVTSSLLQDFIKIRKNYIIRDLISVRFIAHKLKGCFR
jgi:hypothetical protein